MAKLVYGQRKLFSGGMSSDNSGVRDLFDAYISSHIYIYTIQQPRYPGGSITINCLYPWGHLGNITFHSYLGI